MRGPVKPAWTRVGRRHDPASASSVISSVCAVSVHRRCMSEEGYGCGVYVSVCEQIDLTWWTVQLILVSRLCFRQLVRLQSRLGGRGVYGGRVYESICEQIGNTGRAPEIGLVQHRTAAHTRTLDLATTMTTCPARSQSRPKLTRRGIYERWFIAHIVDLWESFPGWRIRHQLVSFFSLRRHGNNSLLAHTHVLHPPVSRRCRMKHRD